MVLLIIFMTILFGVFYLYVFEPFKQKDARQHQNAQHLKASSALSIDTPKIKYLRYFCTNEKRCHVSVWPKDQKLGDYLEFDIAGMTFRQGIDKYIGEHVGILEAEPTNPYDANAIKILSEDGHHVGYVPKDQTQFVREFGSLPRICYFYIGDKQDSGGYFSDCYITRNNP